MEVKKSKLQPQSPYWYEDLPVRTAPIKTGDESDEPNLYLDLLYVGEHVFELSRATSIQRGFGLLFGVATSIGFIFMLPFIFGLITTKDSRGDDTFWSVLLVVMLCVLVVAVIFVLKKCVRTPLGLPIIFDRKNGLIFSREYVTSINPFKKWETVVKKFDWSCVEAEVGKIAGYNGKTYSIRYGLMLAQCEPGTTKVRDRIIIKSEVMDPRALHQMWAYIRGFMNEGPEKLGATKPFPRDVSFRRCMLEFYPFFDFTEEGKRIRAQSDIVELGALFIVAIPMFWLFLPAGLCEYIAQRLAPKTEWPEYVLEKTGLRSSVPENA